MAPSGTLTHDAAASVSTPAHRDHGRDGAAEPADVPDADLIEAVRRGDTEAYGALYRRHEGDVRRLARRLSRHTSEADDVTSEVFASTLQAIRNGAGPHDDARPYLLRSVRHTLYSMHRNGDSGRARVADDPTEFERLAAVATDEPLADDLSDAFRQLPDRFRSVLWLTEVEGATPTDVAAGGTAGEGVSAGAIASLTHRARCALRRQYLTSSVRRRRCTSSACRSVRDLMPGVVLGDAAASTMRRVDEHVTSCDECHAALDDMAMLADSMSSKSLFGLVLAVAGSTTASIATLGGASAALPIVVATGLSVAVLAGDTNPTQAAAGQPSVADTDHQVDRPSRIQLDAPRRQAPAPAAADDRPGDVDRGGVAPVVAPNTPANPPTRGTAGEAEPTTSGSDTPDAGQKQPTEADDVTSTPGDETTLDDDVPADEPTLGGEGPADEVVDDIDGTTGSAEGGLGSVTEPVASVVGDVTEPLDEALDPVTAPLAETLDDVTEPVDGLVSDTLEPVVDDGVAPTVEPLIDVVDDATKEVVDEIVEPTGALTDEVIAPVDDVLDEVTDPVSDLTDGLESDTLDSILDLVSGPSDDDTTSDDGTADETSGGLLSGLLG